MQTNNLIKISLYTLCIMLAISCKSKKDKIKEQSNQLNTQVVRKDSSIKDVIFQKAPIINLEQIVLTRQFIIYKKDSANVSGNISSKMREHTDREFPEVIRKMKVEKIGSPMAWFLTESAPFYFETGLEINKKPKNVPKPFKLRIIEPGKAIVAHYFGPYSNTIMAYEVLNDWLKTNHKVKIAGPYEVYVDSPFDEKGKAKDPYKVQTDIICLFK